MSDFTLPTFQHLMNEIFYMNFVAIFFLQIYFVPIESECRGDLAQHQYQAHIVCSFQPIKLYYTLPLYRLGCVLCAYKIYTHTSYFILHIHHLILQVPMVSSKHCGKK